MAVDDYHDDVQHDDAVTRRRARVRGYTIAVAVVLAAVLALQIVR